MNSATSYICILKPQPLESEAKNTSLVNLATFSRKRMFWDWCLNLNDCVAEPECSKSLGSTRYIRKTCDILPEKRDG